MLLQEKRIFADRNLGRNKLHIFFLTLQTGGMRNSKLDRLDERMICMAEAMLEKLTKGRIEGND